MGEYATRKLDGENIKIGTCEDMYYLRFDQRRQVRHERGNVDPVEDVHALRFRFPWPDEDHIKPGGEFHSKGFDRAVVIPGLSAADLGDCFDHNTIQFSAPAGYLVSLPCPENKTAKPNYTIHRNGFKGALLLTAQKQLRDGRVVPIVRCACGAAARVETPADIERIAVAFRSQADRQARTNDAAHGGAAFLHAVADRVLAGILETVTP